jgi:hypothetical protein
MQGTPSLARRRSDAPRPIQRMGSAASMRRRLGGSEIDTRQPRVVGDHYVRHGFPLCSPSSC